ncbi:MAG: RND family transporter, partial [Phycisphaerae bacterium]
MSQIDTDGDVIHVIGAPVAEALLGTHILEDLGVPDALLGQRVASDAEPLPSGLPRSWYQVKLLVAQVVGLVPVAIAVMALVFWIAFRRLTAAMLPLIEVGAALVFVFGLMGWAGVPVYLTIAVLPVILTAIGVADEIHIFSRYAEVVRAAPQDDVRQTVGRTMDEMWVPVVKTSLTTSIGFLSFALSPIVPVRMFGLFTAVGIIFCMLWSLSAIPAMLVLIPPRWLVAQSRSRNASDPTPALSPFGRLAAGVLRWRYVVVLLALIVAAIAPLGVQRVQKQDSWINGFSPQSEFYQATQYFDEQFLGTHILQVCVDAGYDRISLDISAEDLDHLSASLPGDAIPDLNAIKDYRVRVRRLDLPFEGLHQLGKYRIRNLWQARVASAERDGDRVIIHPNRRKGSPRIALRLKGDEPIRYELVWEPLTSPDVLHRFADLEAFIGRQTDLPVGGVLGPAAYQATTHFMVRARKEGTRSIPTSYQRVEEIWNRYKVIRGEYRLRQAVDADFAKGLVTVYMTDANYIDVAELMRRIRDYERQHLTPAGIKLNFAGDVAVSQALIQAIVSTQIRSLVISLLGILAVTALMGRSIGWGIYCVLPCALAVLVNFAVMGWTGMPLGVATSMFAGMTLGIGVDYAIHLLERYRLARRRNLDRDAAIADALTHSGPAIFIDAVAVALGFGILVLSQVPANARLGGLVVLSIIGCLTA